MSTPFASLIHTRLQHCAQEIGTPAILVGISHGHQTLLTLASQPPHHPTPSIGVNDWMRVGSVTKVFTATLLLRLAEEGRVSLTAPIAQWYPHLPHATQITVSHLLQHTSGLANYTDMPQFFAQAIGGRSWTINEILACVPHPANSSPQEPDGRIRIRTMSCSVGSSNNSPSSQLPRRSNNGCSSRSACGEPCSI